MMPEAIPALRVELARVEAALVALDKPEARSESAAVPPKTPPPAAPGVPRPVPVPVAPESLESAAVEPEIRREGRGQTYDLVLAALQEAGAQWIAPREIGARKGLTGNQVRHALCRLREEGHAESNGARADGSRWRFVSVCNGARADAAAPRAKRVCAPPGGEPAEGTKSAAVLAFVRQRPEGSFRRAIADALGMSIEHVGAEVTRLRERGLVAAASDGLVRPAGAPEPSKTVAPAPGAPPLPGRSIGLVLAELQKANGAWCAPAQIGVATSLNANQVRQALYVLRGQGVAEHNGKRVAASRWRVGTGSPAPAHSTPAAPSPPPAAPPPKSKRKPAEATPPPTKPEPFRPTIVPAKPAPAPPVAHSLRTISPEAITRREDRFRCEPLSCTLTAGACVERQDAANSNAPRNYAAGQGEGSAGKFRMCRACPLGHKVKAALAAHDKGEGGTAA